MAIDFHGEYALGVYGGKWNDSSGGIDASSGTFSDAAWLGEATTVRDFRSLCFCQR